MKKMYITGLLLGIFSGGHTLLAQLSYVMTPSDSVYTPLSGGTSIPDLSAGSDLTVTAALPIGFNFVFDDSTYTEFQMSDNGYLHLGNELGSTGYGNAGGDEVIPNDFTDATAMTPGINTTRPFIAPLWEELAIANIGGSASYLTSGNAPNRILTIEWNKISWRAPTGTDQVSFQVILHETTNVIDFVYQAGAVALGPLPTASIGLAGRTNGDYYSLSDAGTSPVASKTVNTTSINTKPATGQMYTWAPGSAVGIAMATPAEASCIAYFEKGPDCLTITGDFKQAGNYTVDVTDLLGKKISQAKVEINNPGKNSCKVTIPECPPGIYIARISGGALLLQTKFIK